MSKLRFVVVAILALILGGCSLLQQQENVISFTWDGIQYFFTASDDDSGHPYAVGYAWPGEDPESYEIWGSASAADALAGTNTIRIEIGADGDWYASATLWDASGNPTSLYLTSIPEGWIDSFITNRDAIGEQFAGAMPGPFQGETPVLENIVFSVERLPNEVMEVN